MNKNLLQSSIKKAFLNLTGVEDYYVFWRSEDRSLYLDAQVNAFKSTAAVRLSVKYLDIPVGNFIIRNPDRLLKKIAISEDNVSIKLERGYDHKLVLKDTTYEQDFILCDPSVVNIVLDEIEEPISYDLIIPVDDKFIDTFTKAKAADSAETVCVKIKDRKATFELGENNSYSNKSRFFVEQEGIFDMPEKFFSAEIINQILKLNKGTTGNLFISEQGLMKILFEEEFDSETGTVKQQVTYYLLALD